MLFAIPEQQQFFWKFSGLSIGSWTWLNVIKTKQ